MMLSIGRSRQELNLRTRFRRPVLYPLSYGNISAFFSNHTKLTYCCQLCMKPPEKPDQANGTTNPPNNFKSHQNDKFKRSHALKRQKSMKPLIARNELGSDPKGVYTYGNSTVMTCAGMLIEQRAVLIFRSLATRVTSLQIRHRRKLLVIFPSFTTLKIL